MTNLTGDRNGTLLEPGDPVTYSHDEETALSATMLRVVGQQYLIQLDLEIDGQEPFEVSGFRLKTPRGDWGDEAELEAKTAQRVP